MNTKEIIEPEIQKICKFLYDKIYTIIAIKEIINEKNNKEKKLLFERINNIPDTNLISSDIKSEIKKLYEEDEIIDMLKKISNKDYDTRDSSIQEDINFIKKIYEIVDEIKVYKKNNDLIKLNSSIQKLLEETFRYKEVINALIIVFNFYYTHYFTKESINEISRVVDENKDVNNNEKEKKDENSGDFMNKFYSLFSRDTKDTLKIFKENYTFPFKTYYNIYYNKKLISEIFKRIKSEEKFKNDFVNMMKFFINNLIQICICDKDKYGIEIDKIIEKIVLSKINKYINELKTNTV